jgi:hypothetical protein
MVASLRLVSAGFPIGLVIDSIRREEPVPPVRRKASHYVVWRRDYSVYRLDLTAPQHHLLGALAGGRPMGAALRETLPLFRRQREASGERELFDCFRLWGSRGLFRRIRKG